MRDNRHGTGPPPGRKRRPGQGATFKLGKNNGNAALDNKSGRAAQPGADTQFGGARLRRWREFRRGCLAGYADVTLPAINLQIDGVAVFVGTNGPFAMLPSRPLIGERGRQQRGPDGRLAFETVVRWSNRPISDSFSRAVVELIIRKVGPEALASSRADLPPRPSRKAPAVRQLPLDLRPGLP